jgi:probable rRNA maturation factor
MEFRVVNETGRRLPAPRVSGKPVTWQRIFQRVQAAGHARSGTSVALIFVLPRRMRWLNQQYKGKPGPTDVLAFPYPTLDGKGKAHEGSGDIFICPEVLKKKISNNILGELLAHRFVHALLHLRGLRHKSDAAAERMERITRQFI